MVCAASVAVITPEDVLPTSDEAPCGFVNKEMPANVTAFNMPAKIIIGIISLPSF